MSEFKHSFIKLFGKNIVFTPSQVLAANDAASDHNQCSASDSDEQQADSSIEQEQSEEPSKEEPSKDDQEDDTSDQISDPSTLASNNDNPKTPSADVETSSLIISKNGEDGETESVTQDKTLKKPDKILPCPRCNSMDTKFCYYNNYNVNQPRHFCKKCQRYWTAGGTMRNVPVGAGRRKNKNCTASQYRPIVVSDALQMARMNVANGVHNHALRNNGTVLTFGSDSPLCGNMASALNLAEKEEHCVQNGFHRPDQRVLVPCGGKDNEDDHSSACGSSTTTSNSSDKVGNSGLQEAEVLKNYQGFPPQVPCFPGPPWPCAWNPVQWNSAAHQSTLSPSSYPVSFYPAPTYWGMGCTVPGSWNMHCVSPPSFFLDKSAPNSTPNSTVLGKHSRDGKMLNPANSENEEPDNENNDSERSLWIPKTLRIDDPDEAAKSSIWATIRIRNETTGSMGGGLFKSFQSAGNDNSQAMGGSAALHANPAALSRSLNFHENT